MKKPLVFVSGNMSKFELTRRYLRYPVIHHKIDLPEIQSLEARKIVSEKAVEAHRQLKTPVLVEDTSLVFQVLGRLPGTYIKWFFEELGNEGICRLLDGYQDRSAIAAVCFGYYGGTGKVRFFEARMPGSIAKTPRGTGFGWTPIFIPSGQKKTLGEISSREQDKTAMRRIALEKLADYLDTIA